MSSCLLKFPFLILHWVFKEIYLPNIPGSNIIIIIQELFVNELLETFETYLQIACASWNPSQRPGSLLKVNVSLHSLTFSYLGLKLVEYATDEPKI